MTRALVFVLLVPAGVIIACSGGVLPLAEDGCTGSAPSCFGTDLQGCCGQDPYGTATCKSGQWTCGSAGAPGCNGTSCLGSGNGTGTCVGTAPTCFGSQVTGCCGQDPSGVATCENGLWTCNGVSAPGCNGTRCAAVDAGGGVLCTLPCNATEVCVGDQTVGGGEPFPDDAGNCPDGSVHAGDRCAPPPTFSCVPYPTACGATLDCTCAASVCTGNFTCSSTYDGQVNCVFGAP